MIAVDTSVWVAALRAAQSAEARVLNALLDADEILLPLPVRIELLCGASKADRARLRRGLSALPVAYPTEDTWHTVDEWIERASASGQRFGFGDLLIGALAEENGAVVWSLDRDFDRMHRVGLLQIFEPTR
jgi:predicted nucleic acid-binding protein